MTLAPEAPAQADVQIRFDAAGRPLAIRHDGRIWLVDPATESEHRFGRDAWRDARPTAGVGSSEPVTIEYWRVQARLGSTSALRTFTLLRDPPSTRWLLESVDDGS